MVDYGFPAHGDKIDNPSVSHVLGQARIIDFRLSIVDFRSRRRELEIHHRPSIIENRKSKIDHPPAIIRAGTGFWDTLYLIFVNREVEDAQTRLSMAIKYGD